MAKKTKKGPLTKKEKNFIEENYKTQSVKSMAENLNRTVYMVDKCVKGMSFEQETETVEPVKKAMDVSNLYAKNTERGVTVGTEAASMAADESRSKKAPPSTAPRYSKFIHRIKD